MPLKKRKALLILNPKAGKQAGRVNFFKIVSILSKKYDLTVHLTEYAGDACDTAAQADEFPTVICCGGDGTVGQVLDGLAKLDHPVNVGYIPCGTTNDLASALGIPKDVKQAAGAILAGQPIAHDIGLFGGKRRFVYTATFGAFARTSYETPQEMKNLLGHFAYLVSGVTELTSIRNYGVKLTFDTGIFEAPDVILLMVLNTTSVGGILKLPRDEVDFADGIFEVLVIRRPTDILELNGMLIGLTTANFDAPNLYLFRTTSLRVQVSEPVPWTLDGEGAGEYADVNIRCMKQSANFIRMMNPVAEALPKGARAELMSKEDETPPEP